MRKIVLKVATDSPEEVFTESPDVAYKDGEIYDIFNSQQLYTVGSLLGKMRIIVDKKGSILKWIYPMMGAGYEYQILDKEKVEGYRKMVEAYDKKNL